uniref:Uncharacterized protein n=1 Tax=Trichinella nativa TaxID=6335 RepID=A0A0V1IKH3_9BILA
MGTKLSKEVVFIRDLKASLRERGIKHAPSLSLTGQRYTVKNGER